jgi:hypothetical protein
MVLMSDSLSIWKAYMSLLLLALCALPIILYEGSVLTTLMSSLFVMVLFRLVESGLTASFLA